MRAKEKRQSNYGTKDKKKERTNGVSVCRRDEDRKWRGGCRAVMSLWGGYGVVVVVGVSRG